MTRMFVRDLMKVLDCAKCRTRAQANRKFCSSHLAYARRKWHEHVTSCLTTGRCINCRHPHLPGEQRCARCKKENQASCRGWWQENQTRLKERYRARVTAGKCGSCGLRPVIPGHVACGVCHRGGYRS